MLIVNDRMEMTLTALMLFYCHHIFQSLVVGTCPKASGSIIEVCDGCKCFWSMGHILHFITEISEVILIVQCVWPGFRCYLLFLYKLWVGNRTSRLVYMPCCHVWTQFFWGKFRGFFFVSWNFLSELKRNSLGRSTQWFWRVWREPYKCL